MSNFNEKDFGSRLASVRERNGKNQKYTAQQLIVDRNTISNYENGKTIPKCDFLYEFATFYGVSTDFLLFGKDRKNAEDHFLSLFRELSTEQKEAIIQILEGIVR